MLYFIATPIGNLKDITLRALETLQSVDKIYAEDTQVTRKLLTAYQVSKPINSFHQHSQAAKLERIIAELKSGREIAYLTDAGTPGIADPGAKLIRAARQAGIRAVPIPGPSAITTLISVAGLGTNQFRFVGFLPTKKGRQTLLKEILALPIPTVFFETAPRLPRLLGELIKLGAGERRLVIGRELTKKFEEIKAGSVTELRGCFTSQPPKGELTIIMVEGEKLKVLNLKLETSTLHF